MATRFVLFGAAFLAAQAHETLEDEGVPVSLLQSGHSVFRKDGAGSTLLVGNRLETPAIVASQSNVTRVDTVQGLSQLLAEVQAGCDISGDSTAAQLALLQSQSLGSYQLAGQPNASPQTAVPDHKPMVWIHLHNFAGTYMCKEAHWQGEHTPRQNGWPGCLMPEDGCSTQDTRTFCEARVQSGFSFTMIERDAEDADFCEGALFATTLRDPIAGLTSTLLSNKFDKRAILSMLRTGQVGPAPHLACLPAWDTYQHFDNFATRSLGGAYRVPPRQVGRLHLEAAKERLRRMDVLLILEELDLHLPQLASVLSWDLSQTNSQHKENAHACSAKEAAFDEDEKAFLREVNALDYELFAFGKQLAANLTAAATSIANSVP